MQAKIVFRGNKCFREFDLKTVAEKLGLSIDDFNHFALAVDEKNGKTVYASVYAQVPLFETQCSAINVSGWLFDRVFNLVDAELPNKEHPDITTMVYAGDTWSEPEEWIAQVNTTIRDENDDSRHIIILNDSNVTPMWMQDDAIQIPTAATKEQLEKKDNYFTFRSLSMQLADDGNSKYFSFDENSQTLFANCLEAKEYAMRLLHTYCKGVKAVTGEKQDADGHTVYCIQGIYNKPLKASLWDEVREHIIKTRDYKKMNRVLSYTPDAVTDLDLLRYVLDKAAAVLPDELIRNGTPKWILKNFSGMAPFH